jgi:hypothetical protein
MTDNFVDAFDAATNPELPSYDTFGEISIDAWFCVMKKGEQRRAWVDGSDAIADRNTAIDIIIHPLDEMNQKYQQERSLIANSNSWAKFTWPSLQKLGIANVREAKNKFCKVKMVPTGRKYTGKNGDQREETTFEFLALYNSKQDCQAAYAATRRGEAGQPATTTVLPVDPEKQNAYKFAAAIVKNISKETTDFNELTVRIAEKIAGMPVVAKHFTIDSPEVVDLIAQVLQ